jgi:outer membrane protein TolC
VVPAGVASEPAARPDAAVKPAQAMALPTAPLPGPAEPINTPVSAGPPPGSLGLLGNESISMQTALYGALRNNPALVAIRNNSTAPTPESVEVARRFPTTMNPTLWIDYRPINLIPQEPFNVNGSNGSNGGSRSNPKQPYYHWGQQYIYLSLRQPLELSHQTEHRYHIARAAYDQYCWQVRQAEFQTMVQTYNLFQTAAYRREKYRLARELAGFTGRLQKSLGRQVEANQVPAADLVVAEIETEAAEQAQQAARQDYLTALNALQIQMGVPEASGLVEPLGEFALPETIAAIDEEQMIRTALCSRPSVHAAEAQLRGAEAATRLARADRMPNPVVGPEYEMDEGGIQYVGFVYITPIPVLNGGGALVRQRQAEARRAREALQLAQRQVVAEVRSAVAKWNGATNLVRSSAGLTAKLAGRIDTLEQLFDAGQTTLATLMQARQRLIQLENARLDATWQATQAQADLLLSLGAPDLLNALVSKAEGDARTRSQPSQPPPASSSAAPFQVISGPSGR